MNTLISSSAHGVSCVDSEREFVFKIVVVGDYSVGKTTFIKQLLNTCLPGTPKDKSTIAHLEEIDVSPTIGTDFYSRVLSNDKGRVRLQIWDTAGLARYASANETTYRGASLILCLFDVTRRSSLTDVVDRHLAAAADFIPDLDQQRIFVVGNKIDLLPSSSNAWAAQTELRRNRRRATSPQSAFVADDDRTDTELPSGRRGGEHRGLEDDDDEDTIVQAHDVYEHLLDLFCDVHYAEVSARTGEGMSQLLKNVCSTLLENEGEGDGYAASVDPLAGSMLPGAPQGSTQMNNDVTAKSLFPVSCSKPSLFAKKSGPSGFMMKETSSASNLPPLGSSAPGNETATPTNMTAAPSVLLGIRGRKASARRSKNDTASPTNGSWQGSSGMSFDMASPTLTSTMIGSEFFTPAEKDERATVGSAHEGSPHSPKSTLPTFSTNGEEEKTGFSGAKFGTAAATTAGATGNNDEDKTTRVAREKAEMEVLLGKAKGSDGALAKRSDSAIDGKEQYKDLDALHNTSLSALEDGGAGAGDSRPIASLLDEAEKRRKEAAMTKARRGNGFEINGGDDDAEGKGLSKHISDQFKNIDRNARRRRAEQKYQATSDDKVGDKKGSAGDRDIKKEKKKANCKCCAMM